MTIQFWDEDRQVVFAVDNAFGEVSQPFAGKRGRCSGRPCICAGEITRSNDIESANKDV